MSLKEVPTLPFLKPIKTPHTLRDVFQMLGVKAVSIQKMRKTLGKIYFLCALYLLLLAVPRKTN